MGTWQTETQKIKNDFLTTMANAGRSISDLFSGTVNRAVADVTSFFKNGTTVVGINVNQIPAMKEAIRTYVADINTALAELENYDPEVAFKGSAVVPALKEYIEAIKTTCGAIVSNMLAFNDKLTEVQAAYEAKDSAAASVINKTAETTRSAYTEYKESNG